MSNKLKEYQTWRNLAQRWNLAAVRTGLYSSDTDVSDPEKWQAAQNKAAISLIGERDALRAENDTFCRDVSEKFGKPILTLNDAACFMGMQFGELDNLRAENEQLRNELGSIRAQRTAYQARTVKAEAENEQLRRERDSLRTERDEDGLDADHYRSQMLTAAASLREAKSERDQLRAELANWQTRANEAEAELRHLKDSVKYAETCTNKTLSMLLEDTQEQLAAANGAAAVAREDGEMHVQRAYKAEAAAAAAIAELATWHAIAKDYARGKDNAEVRAADLRDIIEQMRQWNKLIELELNNLRSIYKEQEKELAAANAAAAEKDAALRLHHKWHQDNDEHDGYPDSELCDLTVSALREGASTGWLSPEEARKKENEFSAREEEWKKEVSAFFNLAELKDKDYALARAIKALKERLGL